MLNDRKQPFVSLLERARPKAAQAEEHFASNRSARPLCSEAGRWTFNAANVSSGSKSVNVAYNY